MHKYTKHFTPAEASATLPLVKNIVSDILREGTILIRMKEAGEAADETVVRQQTGVVSGLLGELKELGCFFKGENFDVGLVDFPALIEGVEVLLCWKSDEGPTLEWYHPLDGGFASRQRIPQLQPTGS